MAQWVKDPVLSLQSCRFAPWLRNLHMLLVWPKGERKKTSLPGIPAVHFQLFPGSFPWALTTVSRSPLTTQLSFLPAQPAHPPASISVNVVPLLKGQGRDVGTISDTSLPFNSHKPALKLTS